MFMMLKIWVLKHRFYNNEDGSKIKHGEWDNQINLPLLLEQPKNVLPHSVLTLWGSQTIMIERD